MTPTSKKSNAPSQIAKATPLAAGLLYLAYTYRLHEKIWQKLIDPGSSQATRSSKVEPRCFKSEEKPSLQEFKKLSQQTTTLSTYPLASKVEKNTVIYDCANFDFHDEKRIDQLQNELYHILTTGPGVFVLKHFFTDLTPIDSANRTYEAVITREASGNGAKGDHFAGAGSNSRIWNSFSKHCLQDPASFTAYYSNPWFRVVCEAYLGPAYRLTSQVNIVHPGGKPQMPHRDYHLGFQTDGSVVQWPKIVHRMSSCLTLQGAVAHTDMPLESGPTRLLPWSHLFEEGFLAYRREEFVKCFEENWVALPLEKGDAVFFNPALFHAAGENCTRDFSRSANLIQVSSAYGKPMESIDTLPLIEHTYDLLKSKYEAEGMNAEVEAFICAVAEGYPFPTNLDCRPPAPGGMAPESEQDILRRGLSLGWERARVMSELTNIMRASSASGLTR